MNLEATLLFVDFSKVFDFIYREKIEQILFAYGFPRKTVTAVVTFYKNTNAMACSTD